MFLFVYGNLMEGMPMHEAVEQSGGKLVFPKCLTIPKFAMMDMQQYPAAVPGRHRILGELWVVDNFHKLDTVEGHPTLFRRIKTHIGWKAYVWMYMFAPASELSNWKVKLEYQNRLNLRSERVSFTPQTNAPGTYQWMGEDNG